MDSGGAAAAGCLSTCRAAVAVAATSAIHDKVHAMKTDLIDSIVGLQQSHEALQALRHQRDKVAAATQGSYEALFDEQLQGISLEERLLVALQACLLTPAPELAAHYRARL